MRLSMNTIAVAVVVGNGKSFSPKVRHSLTIHLMEFNGRPGTSHRDVFCLEDLHRSLGAERARESNVISYDVEPFVQSGHQLDFPLT